MSHSLQSAGYQTVLRALLPRRPNASAPEVRTKETVPLDPGHLKRPDSPFESANSASGPLRENAGAAERARVPERTESRPLRVGIFGRGRLGSAVVERSGKAKGVTVSWALGRGYSPRGPVDVALDASREEAVRGHVEWALATGTDLVIGTSGWDIPELEDLVKDRIGVLVASNFSLGAALLRRFSLALGRFAAAYPEADLGVSERHHRAKIDSPSGTAKSLAAALIEGCPRYQIWGAVPAKPGVLPISSLRAGYEIGYHEVLLDAPAETITLTHAARSRDLFAQGALEALRWIRGRKGVFHFDDMAAELIDPLFRFEVDAAGMTT